MTQLPVPVYEREVEEMFSVVDTDHDGRISYQEFCVSFIRNKQSNFLSLTYFSLDDGKSRSSTGSTQNEYINQYFWRMRY